MPPDLTKQPRIPHRSQYSNLPRAIHSRLQVTTLPEKAQTVRYLRTKNPSFTPLCLLSPRLPAFSPHPLLSPLPLPLTTTLLLLLPDPQPRDPSNQPSPQPRIGSNIPASLSPYPSTRNRSQSSQRRDCAKAMSYHERLPNHSAPSMLFALVDAAIGTVGNTGIGLWRYMQRRLSLVWILISMVKCGIGGDGMF